MTRRWSRISEETALEQGAHFDVIVVGSGYGGGVAASRLARCGKSVAVLERGREMLPGSYPRDMATAGAAFQKTLSGETLGDGQGLFDLRIYDGMNVLVGCGLGGTSLINANVAIEPDPRVFEGWAQPEPEEGGDGEGPDWPTALAEYFAKARAMLGSTPYPENRRPPKLKAMERVAAGLGAELERPDINVTFKDGHNAAGVWQSACVDCGDCVTGCNYGAKNTTLMNYLPDAHANGAKIYTGIEVLTVARNGDKDRWRVQTRKHLPDSTNALEKGPVVTADVVILAAGTLGSTEILLRSRDTHGLSLSGQLGRGFSGNGDAWSFAFNANMARDEDPLSPQTDKRAPVHAVGAGPHHLAPDPVQDQEAALRPGPCITGSIYLRGDDLADSVMIQEGVMPGAFAPAYSIAIPALATLESDPFRFGDMAIRAEDFKTLGTVLEQDPLHLADTVYTGQVSRTLPFLTFGHDGSKGEMSLEGGRISVAWTEPAKEAVYGRTDKLLEQASDAIQAEYMPFLTSIEAFDSRTMVVHPLGGCGIGADRDTGVVNTWCQVFQGPDGTDLLWDGLYVMDGAVVPTSLGSNPHLTITALAERAVHRLAAQKGWLVDRAPVDPRAGSPVVQDTAADPLAQLDDVIAGFQAIHGAIRSGSYELAEMLLKGFWRTLRTYAGDIDLPSVSTFVKFFGTPEALVNTTDDLVRQFLDILVPARAHLGNTDMTALFAHLEGELGDVSPAAVFPESMEGYLTNIGLDDPETDFDPHTVLAQDSWHSLFTADLTSDAIGALMADPVGEAKIENGVLRCDGLAGVYDLNADFTLTGTFKFLELDEDAVDRWRVIYTGTLEGTAKTSASKDRSFQFHGEKTLQNRSGSHWWRDLCDLNVDIRDLAISDPKRDLIARGRMQVSFEAAVRQLDGFDVSYTDLDGKPKEVWEQIKTTMGIDKACCLCPHVDVSGLPDLFRSKAFRVLCTKAVLNISDDRAGDDIAPSRRVADLYKGKFMARAAALVFRSYGGIYAYSMNFANQDLRTHPPVVDDFSGPEFYYPEPAPGVFIKLTRYKRPDLAQSDLKGPVILANGFGVKASAFRVPTTKRNIVDMLVKDGFDVWLFDYRGSGDAAGSTSSFTIDNVATEDWPCAINMVLDRTGADSVQVLAHCVGSLSLFMALLSNRDLPVRSVIASQLGAHGIVNWFKNAQFDTDVGDVLATGLAPSFWPLLEGLNLGEDIVDIAKNGMSVLDVRAPSDHYSDRLNQAIDGLLWSVPHFGDVPCTNPTCHRINFVFGPTYRHENLNQATHSFIREMFGAVSATPLLHLALMFNTRRLMSAKISADGTVTPDGAIDYYSGHANLDMPIHFIAGAKNAEILPEATLRTQHWLQSVNDRPDLYTRHVYPDYGHMDCFIGKTASDDIFEDLIELLRDPTATEKYRA